MLSAVKAKLLQAALAIYLLAIVVTVFTAPSKRFYWPLYLPLVAAVALLFAGRRR
jgi:4-amino-4-deoxy-L-arabinose transferase-like glycosyltransferase